MRRVIAFPSGRQRATREATAASRTPLREARGGSLVDVLIGLAVAMLTLAVVYEVFLAADTVRRNAASVADAQGNAAFALFALASQIGNAGAGWASAAQFLDTCPVVADAATTLRPIDVLITDGGAADRPDTLVVRQSFARAAAMPAAFASATPAGTTLRIESPAGFDAGDRVVAITRTGHCATTQVTSVGIPAAGVVDVAHTGIPIDLPVTSVLVNLGPAARASSIRFDVASSVLRSTDIVNGDAPVPLASYVVNLKFQYGIDADGDGTLDTWVRAETAGPWSPAALLAAPRATLERIKAVRIGIIVRSDRIERALTGNFHWVLFDCEQDDKSACPGRLEGTFAPTAGGSYRYRILETIVPLRNVIWNRGA
jgi:type IV pilus assembly protein PilW